MKQTPWLIVVALLLSGCSTISETEDGPDSRSDERPVDASDQVADSEFESQSYPPDIVQAIQDFQSDDGSRFEQDYAVPLKLLPLLTKGLSQDEVAAILGPPEVQGVEQGGSWNYTLFYGMYIKVSFDADGNLDAVDSPLLAEDRAAELDAIIEGLTKDDSGAMPADP